MIQVLLLNPYLRTEFSWKLLFHEELRLFGYSINYLRKQSLSIKVYKYTRLIIVSIAPIPQFLHLPNTLELHLQLQ